LTLQVFPYGSVPLKTYLFDGDIVLTALSSPMIEDALVSDVHAVLKGEELNEAAPYEVKDVHCIDAEVKLVKCLVQDIAVDISFNKLGGLCTLCFLEQVDRLVGKDHLFKRSIILIKAWCYYESRILGAHRGLISTYALETLVLYVFHLFHSSLSGPLSVFYRFLDYYSKFDWENYCISLNGPVCKSSMPNIVANLPENRRDNLLLSEEFLRKCVDMFSVPSRGLESNLWPLPLKHLNIIDPLKNNNLGRNVSRANFFRIRSAFKFGALKLGQILLLPRERIGNELNKFFTNTMERPGSNCWIDEQNFALFSGSRGSVQSISTSSSVTCCEDGLYLKSLPAVYSNVVSSFCFSRNAKGFVTSEYLAMKSENDSSDCSSLGHNLGTSLLGYYHHAYQSFLSGLLRQNGDIENANPCGKRSAKSVADGKMNNSICSYSNQENILPNGSAHSTAIASISGSSQSLNTLLQLSGEYERHFCSVLYGQYCHLYAVSGTTLSRMSSHSQNKDNRDPTRPAQQSKKNGHSQMNSNGFLAPPFYSMNPCVPSSVIFGFKEMSRSRGTATYIPNMVIYLFTYFLLKIYHFPHVCYSLCSELTGAILLLCFTFCRIFIQILTVHHQGEGGFSHKGHTGRCKDSLEKMAWLPHHER
ncbi:LOW QUALITY PROTEIN: hypothetical protein CFOL_v3_02161, partial [Cephalotus follicularis]